MKKCVMCGEWAETAQCINLDGEPCDICDPCYYSLKEKQEIEEYGGKK